MTCNYFRSSMSRPRRSSICKVRSRSEKRMTMRRRRLPIRGTENAEAQAADCILIRCRICLVLAPRGSRERGAQMNYTLQVNGLSHTVDAEGDTPLLWVLRDLLDLTGSKFGCGIGACGACTVLLDGAEQQSCQIPISRVDKKKVTTIEGLSKDGSHPLQKAWIEHDVPQCGYCQAGQIMAAAALLKKTPHPTDADIDQTFASHIC